MGVIFAANAAVGIPAAYLNGAAAMHGAFAWRATRAVFACPGLVDTATSVTNEAGVAQPVLLATIGDTRRSVGLNGAAGTHRIAKRVAFVRRHPTTEAVVFDIRRTAGEVDAGRLCAMALTMGLIIALIRLTVLGRTFVRGEAAIRVVTATTVLTVTACAFAVAILRACITVVRQRQAAVGTHVLVTKIPIHAPGIVVRAAIHLAGSAVACKIAARVPAGVCAIPGGTTGARIGVISVDAPFVSARFRSGHLGIVARVVSALGFDARHR